MKGVYKHNPESLWTIHRRSPAGGEDRLTGYFGFLHLNAAGLNALHERTLNGREPDLALLARAGERPAAIYVWAGIARKVRAIAEMLQRGRGHVVNISATIADYADSGTPCVLTALTKGGLAAATRSLAIEYASRGIRVNAVSPGIIQTPVHPAESYAGLGAQLPPVGHVGQVSDIVGGILFLESAPFITGEILHIDGGQIAGH